MTARVGPVVCLGLSRCGCARKSHKDCERQNGDSHCGVRRSSRLDELRLASKHRARLLRDRLFVELSWAALRQSRQQLACCLFATQSVWRRLEGVEFATLQWVAWFHKGRLLEPIGHIPPGEYKAAYYRRQDTKAALATLT
jgi:transposase InsO family protein